MHVDHDDVSSDIGDNAQGIAAGKNIRQRIRRNSPNIILQLTDGLNAVQSELLEMSVDIKLLYTMSRERQLQMTTLQNWMIAIGVFGGLQFFIVLFSLIFIWFSK